jgi:hypothetical protein
MIPQPDSTCSSLVYILWLTFLTVLQIPNPFTTSRFPVVPYCPEVAHEIEVHCNHTCSCQINATSSLQVYSQITFVFVLGAAGIGLTSLGFLVSRCAARRPLGGGSPLGINPAVVYGFPALAPAQMDQLDRAAQHLATSVRIDLGLPGVGGVPGVPFGAAAIPAAPRGDPATAGAPAGGPAGPASPAPAASRIALAVGCWVLDEPAADFETGVVFGLPAGAVQLGTRALVWK